MSDHTLSRAKRDTDQQIAAIMQSLDHLYGMPPSNLNVTFGTNDLNKPSLITNTIPDSQPPSCIVLSNGNVNCSNIIYHDPKTWRRSRNSIDAQIHKLRMQLDDLKEIRRHLKEKRPILGVEELFKNDSLIHFENDTIADEKEHLHRHQHKPHSSTTTTTTTTEVTSTTTKLAETTPIDRVSI